MDLKQRLREGRTIGSDLRWTVTDIHREAADRIAELEEAIAKAVRHAEGNGMRDWSVFKRLKRCLQVHP